LRNLLYIWQRYGIADAEKAFGRAVPPRNSPRDKAPAPFADVVRGRVQYVGSVKGWDHDVYVSLARSLAEVHPSFNRKVTAQSMRSLYAAPKARPTSCISRLL
jgi:RNA-directed DNA polymerase